MRTLDDLIVSLADYGVAKGLIGEEERIYTQNLLLDLFGKPALSEDASVISLPLEELLGGLLDAAWESGILRDNGVTTRDLFDTRIMNCLTPRPGEIQRAFRSRYARSPREATDWFYALCQDCGYIRAYRICRDVRWKQASPYGALDVTINLSKPEKDPLAIAAARTQKQSGYPKCQLCVTNEGYAGTLTHPARQNLRILPITLNGEPWGFQYSPYSYYNEHCIALNSRHVPMKVDRAAFRRLFDFVRQFPHYFIGSNADLPIVGGSILTHDHFQGGRYTFAMEKAPVELPLELPGYPGVEAGIVRWPLSVIRLRGESSETLTELAGHILDVWREYSDPEAGIFAYTDGQPHNTVTPIARMRQGKPELDLVLRNNITTPEHPLGVFHPHESLHHIKKENIGLIEVMGLAVLPSRLKMELAQLRACILSGRDPAAEPALEKHAAWARAFLAARTVTEENVDQVLQEEVGKVFVQVLEDAGVYKCTPEGRAAFMKFTKSW